MSVVELNNHSTKSWSFGQSFLHTSCRHKKYGATWAKPRRIGSLGYVIINAVSSACHVQLLAAKAGKNRRAGANDRLTLENHLACLAPAELLAFARLTSSSRKHSAWFSKISRYARLGLPGNGGGTASDGSFFVDLGFTP
jgi:hypothetical protein